MMRLVFNLLSIAIFPALWLARARYRRSRLSPEAEFDREERQLARLDSPASRFYALNKMARLALEAGDREKARLFANELLNTAPAYRHDWNYGNAIYDGHVILGSLALTEGNKESAVTHLLAAGKTPGSPQLGSFGPNMKLAKDMLDIGEKETVLEYLEECGNFWRSHAGRLDRWKSEIRQDLVPDFRGNLRY